MKVHLLGLPHTETTRRFEWCAYTGKVRKLATMLTSLGYDVRLYAGEQNTAKVTEHIPIVDRAWQAHFFSEYRWSRDVFNNFDSASPAWREFNAFTIAAIAERMEPGDILAITMGLTQKPVADALPELLPVEVGIGYEGVWAPHRVFESYAWQHHMAGIGRANDVRFFDAVIPNSFEVEDFPLGAGDGGYYLYIGRFIKRKGVEIAAEAVKRVGGRLVMAGQGVLKTDRKASRFQGIDVTLEGDHLSHVGVVGPKQRALLMGAAKAVFVPTTYLEPFGGVAVEAMLCGTPVITTDWGAFTETVRHGKDGYRCRTLAEFVDATRAVSDLDREAVRTCAVERFSTDVVKHQYDAYLKRLATLKGDGWYAL